MNYKIGYHYTTLKNWKSIKISGLKPHHMQQIEEFARHRYPSADIKEVSNGIFVYKRLQTRLSNAGLIMYCVNRHHDTTIVLLKVLYTKEECKSECHGYEIDGTHDLPTPEQAKQGYLVFHEKEPFEVIYKRIPPRRIKFVKAFNVVELLNA